MGSISIPIPPMEVDRAKVRSMFEGPGVEVTSVRVSRRDGRRFVHVRVDVADIRQLSRVAPFSWSTYQFDRRGDVLEFKQVVGPAAAKAVGDVGWNGNELVAFRMHIPSVIAFHNAPSKKVQRGNILEWEQPLAERLKGVPIDVEVNMEPDSILYTTLLLFGSTIVLAAVVFGVVIWRVAQARARRSRGGPVRSKTRPTRQSLELFERCLDFSFRLQLVLHLEREERTGDRPRQHPIHLAVHNSLERDATALDDDVNRRIHHRRVRPEVVIAVDRPRNREAQLVVELRHGKHFDLDCRCSSRRRPSQLASRCPCACTAS